MEKKLRDLRKKLAAKAGFTLVELIVVIAILAILAAVAVPTYTGYIAKAKEAADLQTLSSVSTAVVGLEAAAGHTVSSITVTKDNTGITVGGKCSGGDSLDKATDPAVKALTGTLSFSDNFSKAELTYTNGVPAEGGWTVTRS